jgi:hypothetical protein
LLRKSLRCGALSLDAVSAVNVVGQSADERQLALTLHG